MTKEAALAIVELKGYISDTPELLSLLYDLDLLPEQCEVGSLDWKRMIILAEFYRRSHQGKAE